MTLMPLLPYRAGILDETVVARQAHVRGARGVLRAGVQFRPGLMLDK
jgi:hypothetical protein